MKPTVGQRVVVKSLLKEGDFLGEIVDICFITDDCTVRLDSQEKLVHGVLYFDEGIPEEISCSHWQVCCPIENK